jgi:hypothetical protein
MAVVSGGFALLRGSFEYRNYWRASVFAPVALIIGALTIFVAIKGRRS